jgi:putative transcriptional regulator
LQYTSIYHAMELNRLKIVLVEKKRTGKWLAEVLKKNEATISRWCTNESQPSIETLFEIAKVLDIDVKDLLVNSKEQ